MITVEYFSRINPKRLLSIIQMVHNAFPNIKYDEYLDKLPQNKYQYYLDNISFGGVYIQLGKYTNYDKMSKTFDLLPMFQIRVNPNKHMHEPFFIDLLSKLKGVSGGGYLKKYDYAVDVPLTPDCVKIFDSKKEPGLYKGTRYYGQAGRHGYLKVYDKKKDMERFKEYLKTPLTRIEHTLKSNTDISLEKVYIFESESLNVDKSILTLTDKAIIDMYQIIVANNLKYDLSIGRTKMEKLKEYIFGQYALLDYGTILIDLIANIKTVFGANEVNSLTVDDDILTQNVCMIQDNEPELLFD